MVHYIARVLTDVAKTAKPGGVAGVILSQLTPGGDDVEPSKYSIRDSKDLTQMSEVTLIGFIAPRDVPDHGVSKGDRCLKLAKVKEGPAGGLVRMAWNRATASFDATTADNWGAWDNECVFDSDPNRTVPGTRAWAYRELRFLAADSGANAGGGRSLRPA